MRAAIPLIVVLAAIAGCMETGAKEGRVVEGEVEGTSATQRYLKLYVREASHELTLVNFDRVDWYVTGLERAVVEKRVESAAIQGTNRDILNELIAREVVTPSDLNEFRYDEMAAKAESRDEPFDVIALDAEWDARLARVAAEPPETPRSDAADVLPLAGNP